MVIRRTDFFNIWNLDHQALIPEFMSAIKYNHAARIESFMTNVIKPYGPAPVKISQVRGKKFVEPIFDWFHTAYSDPAANDLVDQIYDDFYNLIPDTNPSTVTYHKDASAAYAMLEPYVRMLNSVRNPIFTKATVEEELWFIVADWNEYRLQNMIVEHSDLCKFLRDQDANYMFEYDEFHGNRIVIPDRKAAMTAKLMFA